MFTENPMSIISYVELLRRVPVFSALSQSQLDTISSMTVKKTFGRGTLVIRKGGTSNSLHILLSGRARVMVANSSGREVILSTLTLGDYVGEMSLIDNKPHSASVYCESSCDVLILEGGAFARCMAENSDMSQRILGGLVQRLRGAIRQIESLAFLDVYGRVAGALLEMSQDIQGRRVIPGKVSRLRLAKVVGASRELVSRVMIDLENRSVIQTQEDGSVLLRKSGFQDREPETPIQHEFAEHAPNLPAASGAWPVQSRAEAGPKNS